MQNSSDKLEQKRIYSLVFAIQDVVHHHIKLTHPFFQNLLKHKNTECHFTEEEPYRIFKFQKIHLSLNELTTSQQNLVSLKHSVDCQQFARLQMYRIV